MEHKIGEIVTLPDGGKAEVVEDKEYTCGGCFFRERGQCQDLWVKCLDKERTDNKNVIYKEIKEK